MVRSPGQSTIGFIPATNDAILSGEVFKKVITVNHDFPGYRYATKPTVDPANYPLQKNNLFYRETTSPGKYVPIIMSILKSYASGDPSIEVPNNDKNKLGIGSANLLHFWDNSASAFASGGNDRDRYVTSVGADDSGDAGSGYAELTINGTITYTPEATVDGVIACIDSGIINVINYVLVDEEIDLRAAAKTVIGADFAIDGVYDARINTDHINGYDLLPATFKTALRDTIKKLMLDTPQL